MTNDATTDPTDGEEGSTEADTPSAESFVDLRLTGGRFERAGFPVRGLIELERLEDLIQTVAKALWKRDHPDRVRVPKDFTTDFDLRLTRVDPGSVVPVLERPYTEEEPGLFDVALPDYFDQSIEVIEGAFAGIVKNMELPVDFPETAAAVMARFGSSFTDDERAIFRASKTAPIEYSSNIRKRFFGTIRQGLVSQDGSRVGRISALDVDEQTFTFAGLNSNKVPGVFTDPQRWSDLREVLKHESDTCWVRLQGTFRHRPDSSVHSVADVEAVEVFDVPGNLEWGQRLLELADLQDGWVEEGEAISTPSLELVRDVLQTEKLWPSGVPSIFPTPAGGVQLEWINVGKRFVASVSPNMELEFRWSSRENRRDREIKNPVGVKQLVQFLEEYAS